MKFADIVSVWSDIILIGVALLATAYGIAQ